MDSNLNRTGILAATDSTLTFVPFSSFLPLPTVQGYIQLLSAASSSPSLNGLQQKQLSVHSEWLNDGVVPQIELLVFSKGLVSPLAGESYVTILAGLEVSDYNLLKVQLIQSNSTLLVVDQ